MKSMAQWFLWFIILWLLLLTSCLYGSPIIGHFLVKGTNPFEDLYGWRMIVAGLGSMATCCWWGCRGQQYVSRKSMRESYFHN